MEQQLQTVKRQRLQSTSVSTSEISYASIYLVDQPTFFFFSRLTQRAFSKQLLQSGAEQLDKALRDIAQGKTIQDAHEDLSALAAFTGIEFDHVTNLLLPVSSPLTRRYSFRGRAHGLSFRLQIDVRDDNLEILHLRPSLSPELTLVLNDFLHRCARLISYLSAAYSPIRISACKRSVRCASSSRASQTLHAPPRNGTSPLLQLRYVIEILCVAA